MQLQRRAAFFLQDHAELRRVLQGHDFERDLPDAAKMHEAARLFESGGLGVASPADAAVPQFAAALGHRRGVVGEYAETGRGAAAPRRARTLSRAAQDSTFRGAFISDSVRHRSRGWAPRGRVVGAPDALVRLAQVPGRGARRRPARGTT